MCPVCNGQVVQHYNRGPAPTYCSVTCRRRAERRVKARRARIGLAVEQAIGGLS